MTVEELQIIISAKTEAVQSKIAKVKEKIASLQPKKAADVNVSTNKAQGNLKKLQAEIDRTQAKINKLNEKMAGVFAKQDAVASKYTGLPNLTGMTKDQSFDYMVGRDPEMQALNEQLDKLDAETVPLKAHLAEVKEQIASAGRAAEPAAEKTSALSRSMKNASGNMQRAGRSSGFFGRRIKSVLLGMMLYRGVSFIFQSVSEGFQNMAQGNAQANSTMSQLASSALYLKNSIAAALMPALRALTPVIVQVADAISWAANKIAIFIAQVSGQKTVTIAKKTNVDYAKSLNQTGSSASKANKKIKELQRTVMGFDELNVLNKNVNNTLANSPKTSVPDYGSMFQTIKTPTANWEKAKNKVYKFFDTLKDKTDKTKTQFKGLTSSAKEFVKSLNPSFVPSKVVAPAIGLRAFNDSKKKYQAPIKPPNFVPSPAVAPAMSLSDFFKSKDTYQAPIAAPVIAAATAPVIVLAKFLSSKATYQAHIKAPEIAIATAPVITLAKFLKSKATYQSRIAAPAIAFATAPEIILSKFLASKKTYQTKISAPNIQKATAPAIDLKTHFLPSLAAAMYAAAAANAVINNSAKGNKNSGGSKSLKSGVMKAYSSIYGGKPSKAIAAAVGAGTLSSIGSSYSSSLSWLKKLIPSFAEGGIVSAPTLSLIGEGNDNEAIMPLNEQSFSRIADGISANSKNTSSLDTERIIERMDNLEKAIGNMKIVLQADDRKIAESANRGNKSISWRYNPIASS